jgi:glucose-1-phosphate thymidylyltransferase
MSRALKRAYVVPLWGLLAWSAATAFFSMALFFVLGRQPGEWDRQVSLSLLYEIAKAVFIGTTAGTAIRILLGSTENTDPIAGTEIDRVYKSRVAAASVLESAVKNPLTRRIVISGISLRDILPTNGTLHRVWDLVSERLKAEDARKIPIAERLNVRILLLDPHSSEGDFRSQTERRLPISLEKDVPLALDEIQTLRNELVATKETNVLQARLYQHGSFAFQFITDSIALVEQYTYRDSQNTGGMPLIQYARPSRTYEQLSRSCEIVWEHARHAQIDVTPAGVGRGMRESRLIGIFRQDDRKKLGDRERGALIRARAGDLIDIQALSARFYTREVDLESITRHAGDGAKVRLLVVNPTSRNAILRAVADKTAVEDIRHGLVNWTWEAHQASDLYTDVHAAIRRVQQMQTRGCDIELRLSAADLSCSLLLGRDRLFVEQYSYGRSRNFGGGVTLGGEYDAFEYERGIGVSTPEESILESGFEVLWDSYSISAAEYIPRTPTEKDFFEQELKAVQAQLVSDPPHNDITLVVLAAGYGVRIAEDLEKIPSLRGKPKALLPVKEKPIIEWLLHGVEAIKEIRRIIIVTNDKYFGDFLAWRRRNPKWKNVKIISDGTNSNDTRRGAIGALRFAVIREEIRASVLVIGADNFFDGTFQGVVDEFLHHNTGVVVVHDEGSAERVAGRLGVVRVDADERIIDFEEKPENPKSALASTLCYLLTAGNVRLLKAYTRGNQQADNIGEFIRYLVVDRNQDLRAFRFNGNWRDIGTYAEYRALDESLAQLNDRGEKGSHPAILGE